MLSTHSLPSFLSRAGININRPKQLFWYYVGTVDLVLSLLIFLLCLFLAPRTLAWRAVRLIGVLFSSFGAMSVLLLPPLLNQKFLKLIIVIVPTTGKPTPPTSASAPRSTLAPRANSTRGSSNRSLQTSSPRR